MDEGTSALKLTTSPYAGRRTASRVAARKPASLRPRTSAAVPATLRPRTAGAVTALPVREKAAPLARPKVKTRAKADERPHMKLSFRTVAFFLIAMTLLMFIVYGNMELSRIQDKNQAMQTQINALKREETQLRNQFENTVQISEVERYARAELGMVKPGVDQVIYIDLAGEEHAEIIKQKTFWESISDMLSSALCQAGEWFD